MSRSTDLLLTALAPAIWGSTYVVTTLLLPPDYPLTMALLRALPAGLLLLVLVRQLPQGRWWGRVFLLGALNFSLFWSLLFVAAYRLPGGVAATLGALQPLLVIGLARLSLGTPIRSLAIVGALAGMFGVALLVLTPQATLDPLGIAAGLLSALSMALGVVLSRRWQPPTSTLTFTAWQLVAGGVLLIPLVLLLEPTPPSLSLANLAGIAYLSLIGAAFTYLLWFRGIARLEPATVSSLGFLSPVSAVLLGWGLLQQSLSPLQLLGMLVVLGSVWLGQLAQRVAPQSALLHR
ncbi:EamA family transporter [Pseudomonas sp. GOM6]|uniref:EamA family transporter n=1 Tax=Pseudomonas sp. GOM6 TaxID=3036944 RepID=UPI00240919BA|nr:EamA family transporter [Pseudomonas sp. GOM6]MDG1579780.1 EamA family transporter [Pseudomonas sp. GOM6]